MVAGGFAVNGGRINEVHDHVMQLKQKAGIRSEFSWKKYRGGARRDAYHELVQYGFNLIAANKAHLHVIIANFDDYAHHLGQRVLKQEFRADRDTSINRMYYQIVLHRIARYYGSTAKVHLRLDAGSDCADVLHLRNELCAEAYRRYGARPNCIRSAEAMDSEKSGIIQLSDVIVGGIAAHRNLRELNAHKTELMEHVLKVSGRPSWAVDTAYDARKFTVWNLKSKNR